MENSQQTDGGTQLLGGGATGDLIRAMDWGKTPLGPIETWPTELRTTVQTMLSSRVAMALIWGSEGLLVYNDGYAQVCGSKHPAALGARLLDVWPEAADFNRDVIAQGREGRSLSFHSLEFELLRHGAPESVWLDLDYTPVRDGTGTVAGILAMVFDITHRVLAEQRLARSEGLHRFLDALNQEVTVLHEADHVLAATTRLVADHLGLSNCAYADMDADEDGFTIRGNWFAPGSPSIVGHYSLADFGELAVQELGAGRPLIINDNLKEIAPHEAKTFQDIGIAATICMPHVKEGHLRALMAIHDSKPRQWTDYDLAVIEAVTERCWAHIERVGAQALLRAREEQLRLATDAAEIGLWDVDVVNNTMFWPPRVKAMFGISPDVPVSMDDYYAGLHPDDFAATALAYAAAADPERRAVYDVEYRTIGKEDGLIRWVAAKGRGVFEGDTCIRVIGTAIDISHRKKVERELVELNETLEKRISEGLAERRLLAGLVETTDAIILVVDRDYRLLAINPSGTAAWQRIYGVRPTIGHSLLEFLHGRQAAISQIREVWDRALAGEEFTQTSEFGAEGHDTRCYEMKFRNLRDANNVLIGAYQLVEDVTERIAEQRRLAEAQEQLRQSQKLESLGQLTGGVAHDFNNLLTPIMGSLDLLKRKQVGGDRERRLIDGALQSAERARVLVHRLLAFARRQPLQPKAVDIGRLLDGMVELITSTIGPQIQVVTKIGELLPAAHADENQLEMALLNLSLNARDAMPYGGTLTLSAEEIEVSGATGFDLKPGRFIRLSVNDTGLGMDELTAKKAVEPFFSTKGVGKGTGLGLSMVHGLMQQSGGDLRIASRPGEGTTIELWMPVSFERLAGDLPQAEETVSPIGKKGIALLVDDEEIVRVSAADMLCELGFTVLEAASAQDALELLRARRDIRLLVTDHLMPGIDGTQLVRLVREADPDLPCMIISGYAEVEGIASDIPRLTKPFRASEMAAAVESLGFA